MPEPKSRRIPYPIWFALAAMLMLVLWIIVAVRLRYHREQVAVRELERLGLKGVVFTYWSGPEWIYGPEWMQEKVDDGWLSWFDRVNGFDFSYPVFTDEGLKHLSGLTKLTHLELYNAQVSDDGLKHLSGLTNLKGLGLTNTQVSDEGLKYLSGLTNLIELYLNNTQVTDVGVKELQKALPDCMISY